MSAPHGSDVAANLPVTATLWSWEALSAARHVVTTPSLAAPAVPRVTSSGHRWQPPAMPVAALPRLPLVVMLALGRQQLESDADVAAALFGGDAAAAAPDANHARNNAIVATCNWVLENAADNLAQQDAKNAQLLTLLSLYEACDDPALPQNRQDLAGELAANFVSFPSSAAAARRSLAQVHEVARLLLSRVPDLDALAMADTEPDTAIGLVSQLWPATEQRLSLILLALVRHAQDRLKGGWLFDAAVETEVLQLKEAYFEAAKTLRAGSTLMQALLYRYLGYLAVPALTRQKLGNAYAHSQADHHANLAYTADILATLDIAAPVLALCKSDACAASELSQRPLATQLLEMIVRISSHMSCYGAHAQACMPLNPFVLENIALELESAQDDGVFRADLTAVVCQALRSTLFLDHFGDQAVCKLLASLQLTSHHKPAENWQALPQRIVTLLALPAEKLPVLQAMLGNIFSSAQYHEQLSDFLWFDQRGRAAAQTLLNAPRLD